MDQATLVANQIDDVPRLIDRIKEDNIDVKAVYWLYTSESDLWYLYIATDLVDQIGITEAYKKVLKAMKQLPNLRIERFRLKLVSPADKVASAIVGFARMRRGPSPTEIQSSTLGGMHIEHAFVY
jgi:hypothetical protein